MYNKLLNKCKEKEYEIIKEIDKIKDNNKVHLENKQGYKGVVYIGKFLRGTQDVAWFSNKNPYMIENIKLWLKTNAPNLTLKSDKFERGDKYLEFECCFHGTYISTWDNVKSGYNCPKCKSEKISNLKRNDIEKVYEAFYNNGFQPLFDIYKNENELLDGVNSEGYKISVSYNSIKKSKPQIFGYANKYTIDNIKLWLKLNGYNHIEVLSKEYIDAHTDLELYCKVHNEKIYATWNNISKGKMCYKCGIEKRSGENHPKWNPNITDEERKIKRNYHEYSEWRSEVYKRDGYACICCKTKGCIEAHHLNGYNWDREHRTDINNGVTLCEDCHNEFHNIYGRGDNTLEQFQEFINNKGLRIVLP